MSVSALIVLLMMIWDTIHGRLELDFDTAITAIVLVIIVMSTWPSAKEDE
jgi:hypothetical protein